MSSGDDARRPPLHFAVLALPFVGIALLAGLRIWTTPDARGFGTHEQFGFAPCRFRDWFDGPCPTCGVTTAASQLVHGDVVASWQTQPFGAIAALLTVAGAFTFTVLHRRGVDLGDLAMRHGAAFWTALAVLLGLCWMA